MNKKKKNMTPVLLALVILLAAGLGFMVWKVQRDADSEVIIEAGQQYISVFITDTGLGDKLISGDINFPITAPSMSALLIVGS